MHRRPAPAGGPVPSVSSGPSLASEVHALDAKLRLITQRLKVIESNEQVIGRTLVAHKKKMQEADALLAASGGAGKPPDLTELKTTLKEELKTELSAMPPPLPEQAVSPDLLKQAQRALEQVEEIRHMVEELQQQVQEMKYVVDTINPLEYVTVENLNEILEEKFKKLK